MRKPIEVPPEHIIQFAIEASLNSPCRSKRGAAIFDDDALISLGWNHKPRGFDCDGSDACKATCGREAVHAEQMALLGAWCGPLEGIDMLHVKTVDGKLVPSGGPSCVECSKLILAARLGGMWLYHDDGWKRYGAGEFHRLSLEAQRNVVAEYGKERYRAGYQDGIQDGCFCCAEEEAAAVREAGKR